MARDKGAPVHQKQADLVYVQDGTWLSLKQLRLLLQLADELKLDDSALVSHTAGDEHPTLRGYRTARTIVIEGTPRV